MGYTVDLTAVVIAAVVAMIIGAIWYSPKVFGHTWMRLIGRNKEELRQGAMAAYLWQFVVTLVMAFILAEVIGAMGSFTAADGVATGFLMWLGFIAPVMIGSIIFEQRSWKLFMITAGHSLVSLVVMGGILAAWTA